MTTVVKKTISLSSDLADEIKRIAVGEEKTLSSVVQEALKNYRKTRLKTELFQIQGYWSSQAKARGILTEKDLRKYLKR